MLNALTLLNLLDIIFEAVKATTKYIIFEVQLGGPQSVNLRARPEKLTYHGETNEHFFGEDGYSERCFKVPECHCIYRQTRLPVRFINSSVKRRG